MSFRFAVLSWAKHNKSSKALKANVFLKKVKNRETNVIL